MTLENFNYRTSSLFLRNQFDSLSEGHLKIPTIPKANLSDNDFINLLLLGFDKANANDDKMTERMVHFFLYDYKFEGVWKTPDKYIDKLKPYKAVLSPDFSMYREMNPAIQMYNTFRNRWCGAYFAYKQLNVIPTVSWGDENTFDFCFLGIPKGSTVAVSTYMVSEHGSHKDQKDFFLKGYNEMLRQIEPERIICYNTPFPEMEGDIVFVDYELSSWKYQQKGNTPKKYISYILGELPLPKNSGIIIKRGYIPSLYEEKGMGSAYGGEWQPKKPEDERFLGEPGEIKETRNKQGFTQRTKIGADGKAEMERHETDHNRPWAHTKPHDHKIDWSKGHPEFSEPMNYPSGAPEFKSYKEQFEMSQGATNINYDDYRFKSISDFKWSLSFGGEIEFTWGNKAYSITRINNKLNIGEGYYLKDGKPYNILSHKECTSEAVNGFSVDSPDQLLDYIIDGQCLKEIVTEITVTYRTL